MATVRVDDEPAATDVGEKLHVAPEGQPEAVRPMFPTYPFRANVPIVDVADRPALTDADVGLAEIEKSGALTVTVNVAVWLRPVSTPCTTTGYVPAAVEEVVVTVSVDGEPTVAVAGAATHVVFAGHPDNTERVTVPEYPFRGETPIEEVAG